MIKNSTKTTTPSRSQNTIEARGIVLGHLLNVDGVGNFQVDYPGAPEDSGQIAALSTVPLTADDIGRRVALAFESERIDRPIIMGVIHEPLEALISQREDRLNESAREEDTDTRAEALVDGDRMLITAEKEIVLQCGESSITLRRDGRVLIRGADIVSRSAGSNRIKGASIQLN